MASKNGKNVFPKCRKQGMKAKSCTCDMTSTDWVTAPQNLGHSRTPHTMLWNLGHSGPLVKIELCWPHKIFEFVED